METKNPDSKAQKTAQEVSDLLAAMKSASIAQKPAGSAIANSTIPTTKGSGKWHEQNAAAVIAAVFPHFDNKLSADPVTRVPWKRSSLFSLLGKEEKI